MGLQVWAIGYKYEEDVFYDFLKQEDSYNLEPTCFLATRELAEHLIEDELSTQYAPIMIEVLSVSDSVWSWSRGPLKEWDEQFDEEDE